jgi:hypothetical protein
MDSIQIPYHAPHEELPSELPTKDMAERSKEIPCEQPAPKVVGLALILLLNSAGGANDGDKFEGAGSGNGNGI